MHSFTMKSSLWWYIFFLKTHQEWSLLTHVCTFSTIFIYILNKGASLPPHVGLGWQMKNDQITEKKWSFYIRQWTRFEVSGCNCLAVWLRTSQCHYSYECLFRDVTLKWFYWETQHCFKNPRFGEVKHEFLGFQQRRKCSWAAAAEACRGSFEEVRLGFNEQLFK